MKKKLLIFAFAFILVGSCLIGCGREGGTEGNESTVSEGKTELKFWMAYGDDSFDELNALVTKFNESNDKYHLSMESAGQIADIRQKLVTLQKKDFPSVFVGSNDALYEYSTAEYVVPLQKYLDEDDDKWTDDMYDVVKRSYTDQNGDMVGGVLGVSVKGWMVNLNLLNQAGYTLDDITSFEKVAEIAQTAHNKNLCKYGYVPNDGNDIREILTYQGVDIFDGENGYSDKVTKCLYTEGETNAALKKVLELYSQMAQSGTFYNPIGVSGGGKPSFINAQTVFWACTNSYVYEIGHLDLGFEWAFVPFVGVDENAEFKNCALSEGTGLFIANTGNEEEMKGAYEVIKFFAQPENQIEWCTYRGYVPYTNEAAATEEWNTWMKENFPSAEQLVEKLVNAPQDLKLPYSKVAKKVQDANVKIHANISTEPKGDLNKYIQDAADSINQGIELINMREQ